MAASTFIFRTAQGYGTGLTAKARVRSTGVVATNGTSGASTETVEPGKYSVTFTDLATAVYDFTIETSGSVKVMDGVLNHTDAVATEYPEEANVSTQLSALAANLEVLSGGSGDKAIAATVDDGATALANAQISVWSNTTLKALAITNGIGQATLNLANGTYTVVITLDGYTFAGASLVVSANASVTYSMTEINISPPDNPAFCTLAIRCWDAGVVAVGRVVYVQVSEAPTGEGEMFTDVKLNDTTGADGYATFTVPKGCALKYWVNEEKKHIDDVGQDDVVYVENGLGHAP